MIAVPLHHHILCTIEPIGINIESINCFSEFVSTVMDNSPPPAPSHQHPANLY